MANHTNGTILGHPKGLFVLFFTEMWERFSYYGMRALLMLYMINFFRWTQQDASVVYKWYTSLVYLTPMLGGFLADRYLGNKWAVVIGGLLMAVGHFLMAFEQAPIFYTALFFLIAGNGMFKPNMATQVGRLYAQGDPRRDSAYTIFYMGVNLGAFLGPLLCGWLRVNTKWSYHAGFTAAGVGMVAGVLIYLSFLKWIKEVPTGSVYREPDDTKAEGSGFAVDRGGRLHCPQCGAEVTAPAAGSTISCQTCGTRTSVPPRRSAASAQNKPLVMTEQEAAAAPSIFPALSRAAPALLAALSPIAVLAALILWQRGTIKWDSAFGLGAGGGIAALMGSVVTSKLSMAVRDRVLAIFALGIFVVCFWAAFEQAGNAMNVFADKTTNLYPLEKQPPEPSVFPPGSPAAVEELESKPGAKNFFVIPPEWFQVVNAGAIFVIAPIFAWLWVWLPRRGIRLSIPSKMAIGVFLEGWAFILMIWAVKVENQPTAVRLDTLPHGVWTDAEGRLLSRDAPDLGNEKGFEQFSGDPKAILKPAKVHGLRLYFDPANKQLDMNGVLSDTDRDRLLMATVSKEYLDAIHRLALESAKPASQESQRDKDAPLAQVKLDKVPDGFDLRFSGFPEDRVSFDPKTRILQTKAALADRDYKMLLLAGVEPKFREALNELYVQSAGFKLSFWWLFWFYVLCTLGELCVSPVGLSMVSKLAPAAYATMLMGMWHLTSFFGNFFAGLAGESYGAVHPTYYFLVITAVLLAASFVCFLVTRKVVSMMHGVN